MILTGVCQEKASLYEILYETLASWEGLLYVHQHLLLQLIFNRTKSCYCICNIQVS